MLEVEKLLPLSWFFFFEYRRLYLQLFLSSVLASKNPSPIHYRYYTSCMLAFLLRECYLHIRILSLSLCSQDHITKFRHIPLEQRFCIYERQLLFSPRLRIYLVCLLLALSPRICGSTCIAVLTVLSKRGDPIILAFTENYTIILGYLFFFEYRFLKREVYIILGSYLHCSTLISSMVTCYP